ncbi:MAG: stage II sporulation protein M [Planctomycetota bacterium]
MLAAKLIETRSPQWRQLEQLCVQLESASSARKLTPRRRVEFASLYRSACADLALADSYQLPADTVRYLHQLVGRAHNQLYRTRGEQGGGWRKAVFQDVPRLIFSAPAVRIAAALFWLPFLASMFLASDASPVKGFADAVVGRESLMSMEESHSVPFEDRGGAFGGAMSGFYLWHNTTIGLRCFVWGLAFGLGGLYETLFNALALGASFGYMTTVPDNRLFFEFVTAHGPFELTAIVLAAGAGMKMGFALVMAGGLRRIDSLLRSAKESLPILYAAVVLFVGAAFIEGFISPSATLPYAFKAFVGAMSTLALLGYFVVLGLSVQEDFVPATSPTAATQGPADRASPFDDPPPAGPTDRLLNLASGDDAARRVAGAGSTGAAP